MKKCLIVLVIALFLSASPGNTLNHCYARERTTSGRFISADSPKFMWSYNKKTSTMTVKPVDNEKVKDSIIKDKEYWANRAKKLVYKNGVKSLSICYCSDGGEYSNSSLKSLELAGSLRCISERSFDAATHLETVKFKKGIECIGRHAFFNTSIKKLSFPDGLKTIGGSAFENVLWSTIRDIKFNDDLEYIGDNAFGGAAISSLSLPDSVNYIGSGAFNSCLLLEEAKLPNNLRTIENKLFYYSQNLSYCELPKSLIAIKDEAFAYTKIREITVPSNVETLGNNGDNLGIFNNCDKLKKIRITSKKLKTVNPGALSGLPDGVVIEVPKECHLKYSVLFKQAGFKDAIDVIDLDSEVVPARLNHESINMKLGINRRLELLYADESERITWSSSDESIAAVNENGEVTPIDIGEAQISALYKGSVYKCMVIVDVSDANDDLNNLKKLIESQKEYSYEYCVHIPDVDREDAKFFYSWENGRLTGIRWDNMGIHGVIDLNAFTHLKFFYCAGSNSYVTGIEADNLEDLKYICCCADLPDENIHVENAQNIKIDKIEPGW